MLPPAELPPLLCFCGMDGSGLLGGFGLADGVGGSGFFAAADPPCWLFPAPELTAGPPAPLVAPGVAAVAVALFPSLTVNCLNRPGLSLISPVEMLISTNGLATSSIISNRFWCSSADLMSRPILTSPLGRRVFR